MNENEMEYRGSKSVFLSPQPKEIFVKEQRIDGSYFGKMNRTLKLRYILMDCESSYQIKIPSKQLKSRRDISTLITMPSLSSSEETQINPWFLTGFTDAEGCFMIKTEHNLNLKFK